MPQLFIRGFQTGVQGLPSVEKNSEGKNVKITKKD